MASDTMAGQHCDRTALVLYGSETGNAQDVAGELGHITERLHFLTQVVDMNSVNPVSGSLSRKYTKAQPTHAILVEG